MRTPTTSARRRSSIALIVGAALLIASCAGSDGETADSLPDETATAATDPPPQGEPSATEPPPTEPPTSTAPAPTDPPTTDPPPTDPPVTDPPVTETPDGTPDMPFGDGFGPYDVGVETISISDFSGGDRNLTVDVWFPLDDLSGADPEAHQYTFLPGTFYESPRAFTATSESISPDGPFPLVVYSHGSGVVRYVDSNYTEALASNGYIVVAPDHIGNTALEAIAETQDDPPTVLLNRPNDVTRIIDAFLDAESIETVGFVASVNPFQIAVTGHSLGGFTTLAVASGYSNELGEYVADERVGALIALAPATSEEALSDERLASIDTPLLMIAGVDDSSTPIDPNVTRPWELVASSPAWRVDIDATEHQAFTDVCAYLFTVPDLPDALPAIVDYIEELASDSCRPDVLPPQRVKAITNTFAVSFLDTIFKEGSPITAEQVDDQVDFTFASR